MRGRLKKVVVETGLIVVGVLLLMRRAWAGPPFFTDDPEPVEYMHWEVYLAELQRRRAEGKGCYGSVLDMRHILDAMSQ